MDLSEQKINTAVYGKYQVTDFLCDAGHGYDPSQHLAWKDTDPESNRFAQRVIGYEGQMRGEIWVRVTAR